MKSRLFNAFYGRAMVVLIGMILTMISCKKDIMTYNGDDFVKFEADSSFYTFFTKHSSIMADTVAITIDLIGQTSDRDRTVEVVVDDSTTAQEGKHFKVVRPILLERDAMTATANVVVYRSDLLTAGAKHIWLSLKDASELKRADYRGGRYTTYKITLSNELKQPTWWMAYFYNYTFTSERMQFYIDVIGTDIAPLGLPGGFSYVMYRLRTGLLEYNKTHDEPLMETINGVKRPISWD